MLANSKEEIFEFQIMHCHLHNTCGSILMSWSENRKSKIKKNEKKEKVGKNLFDLEVVNVNKAKQWAYKIGVLKIFRLLCGNCLKLKVEMYSLWLKVFRVTIVLIRKKRGRWRWAVDEYRSCSNSFLYSQTYNFLALVF